MHLQQEPIIGLLSSNEVSEICSLKYKNYLKYKISERHISSDIFMLMQTIILA